MSRVWFAGGDSVGDVACLARSFDGVTFEAVPNPFAQGGYAAVNCMGQGGSRLLAGGQGDSGTLLSSDDGGETWTNEVNPLTLEVSGIAYSPTLGLWVIVGTAAMGDARVATSRDGVVWTARTTPADGQGDAKCVVWVPDLGLFVAGWNLYVGVITAAGVIQTSPDGVTWTAHSTPFTNVAQSRCLSLAYHDGLLLAGGSKSDRTVTVCSSVNATAWTARATPFDSGNTGRVESVAFDAAFGRWLAAGDSDSVDLAVAASGNGTTGWAALTTPFDANRTGFSVVGVDAEAMLAGYGTGSPYKVAARTLNGTTWGEVTTPFDDSDCYLVAAFNVDLAGGRVPYTVKIVEQDGAGGFTVIRTITKPVFSGPITRVLNGIGTCGLQFGKSDPALADLATDWLRREVQVFRGSSTVPLWWGVPMNPSKPIRSPVVTIQCAEVIPWLLSRRNMGKTNRHNLLVDPDFESGAFAPNWGTTGVDTATVTTADSILGTHSADLTCAGVAPDASVQQTFTFTASDIGDVIVFAGWYKVVAFTGPAIGNRGLYVEWRQSGVLKDVRYATIDGSTPLGKWRRAQIPPDEDPRKAIWIPPSVTADVNLRGYAIQGNDRWDAMFAGLMESTSTALTGTDIATFVGVLANHAQDAAYDKDDLDILTSTPATGFLVTMAYQHVEHTNIWQAIKDQIDRDQGVDVGYTYTAATRTIVTYDRTAGASGKGADQTALDMSVGGPNLVDYGWDRDGNRATNNLTMLGDGNGPSREEGGYVDNTKFGGRSMEAVLSAPPGSPINSLAARATKIGTVMSKPGVVNLQFRPGLFIQGGTTLDTGDTVTLPAYDGFVDAGTYRATDWAVNPNADVLTLGVAPQ